VTRVTKIAQLRIPYSIDRVYPGNGYSSWRRDHDTNVFARIEVDYSIIVNARLIGLDSLARIDCVERAHDIVALRG
jgi:hypothetical protein